MSHVATRVPSTPACPVCAPLTGLRHRVCCFSLRSAALLARGGSCWQSFHWLDQTRGRPGYVAKVPARVCSQDSKHKLRSKDSWQLGTLVCLRARPCRKGHGCLAGATLAVKCRENLSMDFFSFIPLINRPLTFSE